MNRKIILVVLIKIIVLVPFWSNSQTIDPLYGNLNVTSKNLNINLPNDTNYKYLKKVDNQIIFEKVYSFDSLKSEQIEDLLLASIPNVADVSSFQKSTKIISFSLRNVYIDFKKYGLRRMTMSPLLAFPMSCNLSIVWKDGKYKITASNITFNVVSFGIQKLTDHILNDSLWFDDKKVVTTMGHCVELFFAEKFKIETINTNW
jgi:hypothetical protein